MDVLFPLLSGIYFLIIAYLMYPAIYKVGTQRRVQIRFGRGRGFSRWIWKGEKTFIWRSLGTPLYFALYLFFLTLPMMPESIEVSSIGQAMEILVMGFLIFLFFLPLLAIFRFFTLPVMYNKLEGDEVRPFEGAKKALSSIIVIGPPLVLFLLKPLIGFLGVLSALLMIYGVPLKGKLGELSFRLSAYIHTVHGAGEGFIVLMIGLVSLLPFLIFLLALPILLFIPLMMPIINLTFIMGILPSLYALYIAYEKYKEYNAAPSGDVIGGEKELLPSEAAAAFKLGNHYLLGDMVYMKAKRMMDVKKKDNLLFVSIRWKKVKKSLEALARLIEEKAKNGINPIELTNMEKDYKKVVEGRAKAILKERWADGKLSSLAKKCLIASIVLLPIGIGFFLILPIISSLIVSALLIWLLQWLFPASNLNKEGLAKLKFLRSYKKWLASTRIAELPFTAVEMWDEHFAYAIAFGVARKALEELNISYSADVDVYWEKAYDLLVSGV